MRCQDCESDELFVDAVYAGSVHEGWRKFYHYLEIVTICHNCGLKRSYKFKLDNESKLDKNELADWLD